MFLWLCKSVGSVLVFGRGSEIFVVFGVCVSFSCFMVGAFLWWVFLVAVCSSWKWVYDVCIQGRVSFPRVGARAPP